MTRAGRYAALTRQEAALFGQLVALPGKLITRERLLANLYLVEADEPQIKIIDVIVCKLRKKLSPLDVDIQTVWGRGYRYVPAARKEPA